MSDFPIKVPPAKYKAARDYQLLILQKHNIKLPLWRCFLDIEQPQKKAENDPFRHLRRGLRL